MSSQVQTLTRYEEIRDSISTVLCLRPQIMSAVQDVHKMVSDSIQELTKFIEINSKIGSSIQKEMRELLHEYNDLMGLTIKSMETIERRLSIMVNRNVIEFGQMLDKINSENDINGIVKKLVDLSDKIAKIKDKVSSALKAENKAMDAFETLGATVLVLGVLALAIGGGMAIAGVALAGKVAAVGGLAFGSGLITLVVTDTMKGNPLLEKLISHLNNLSVNLGKLEVELKSFDIQAYRDDIELVRDNEELMVFINQIREKTRSIKELARK